MISRAISRRNFLIGSAAVAVVSPAFAAPALKPKVGAQTNGWPMKQPDFEGLMGILQAVKGLGYTGFECNNRFVRAQFGDAAARKRIEVTGLTFIGVHTSMGDADKEDFSILTKGAASLGVRNIVMSASGLSPDGKFTLEAAAAKCKRLEELGAIARKSGVTLAYHNHMPEFANNNAEMNALADHTDPQLVSFLMDAGHGYQGGGNPADFIRMHSSRIVGCHLKTFKEKKTQVPLGQGDFGFEDLALAIRSTDWAGWLIDEEGNQQGGDTSAVGPDRQYIRKIFGV